MTEHRSSSRLTWVGDAFVGTDTVGSQGSDLVFGFRRQLRLGECNLST